MNTDEAPSEKFDDYIEETEEDFLSGEAFKSGIQDQISRKYYAHGNKTENVKSPAIVVMVAEKPSIALSIATALSGGKFERHTGPAKQCPIFTYSGTFKGHRALFKVTSVAGHIFSRDFPSKF